MTADDEDDEHPENEKLLQQLSAFEFADRYYKYCDAHTTRGPDIPTATQTAVLKETGRVFKYDKREKFFARRDANAPKGCELGININIDGSFVDWILVFGTPAGHLGGPFASLALKVKHLTIPSYRHNPPYPAPRAASKAELAAVIDEGFALYDGMVASLMNQTWK